MTEPPVHVETFHEAMMQANHHQNKMVERRNVGLKIVTGIVTFDLLLLKFGLDAADQISDRSELVWAIRAATAIAFLVLAGMLFQIEISNRRDRLRYLHAEERANRIRQGEPPPPDPTPESNWFTIRRSWAATWPLIGVFLFTVAIWQVAGLVK